MKEIFELINIKLPTSMIDIIEFIDFIDSIPQALYHYNHIIWTLLN